MKKDKKFEIFTFIIIIVITLIFLGIYLIDDIYNKKRTFTIITNPIQIIKCVKWDCNDETKKLIEYNNKYYYSFLDNKLVGFKQVYYNQNSKKLYIFNKNEIKNTYNNELFIATDYANLSIKNIEKKEITNEELNKIVKSSEIIINKDDLLWNYKYVVDFDSDNELENLYIIVSEYNNLDNYYTLLYYENNGRLYELNKTVNISKNAIAYGTVDIILDIFNDNKIEFIYKKSYISEETSCNIIYRLKQGKFIPINECNI